MTDHELATTKDGTPVSIQASPSIASMMEIAVQQGPEGVDALERLAALMERQEDRAARRSYFDALAKFQQERPRIVKNRTVKKKDGTTAYGFTSLDSLASTVAPKLAECGLAYSFDSDLVEGHMVVTCTLRHKDGHSESAKFAAEIPKSTPMPLSGPQKAGQAITYGRRYSLIQILGLTDADEDNDARDESESISPEQRAELSEMLGKIEPGRASDFVDWAAGVGNNLEQMPASKFDQAVKFLQRIKAQQDRAEQA